MKSMSKKRPIIGITSDTVAGATDDYWKYESPMNYSRMVNEAGGVPVLLPYEIDRIGDYLALCDGIIMAGGDDCDTAFLGEERHPAASIMHPARQAFEFALLRALDKTNHPTLGICLGMQMMTLHHGGRLIPHLADVLGDQRGALHRKGDHTVEFHPLPHVPLPSTGTVASSHHQAVRDPGSLHVLAKAEDGVVEAVAATKPGRYYVGVQWHPERTKDPAMGLGVIESLVRACGG
jgi:putative glutamine amidotransferase